MATLTIEQFGARQAGILNGRVLIGRWPQNTVVIDDRSVSRIHAWVGVQDGEYYIADTGSRTGTIVNGEPLHERRFLWDGDEIRIGPAVLRYHSADSLPPDAQEVDLTPRSADELSGRHGQFIDCECGAPLWLPNNFVGAGQCRYCGHTVRRTTDGPPPHPGPPPTPPEFPPTPQPVAADASFETEPQAEQAPVIAGLDNSAYMEAISEAPSEASPAEESHTSEPVEQIPSAPGVPSAMGTEEDESNAAVDEEFSRPKPKKKPLPATGRRVPPPAPVSRPRSQSAGAPKLPRSGFRPPPMAGPPPLAPAMPIASEKPTEAPAISRPAQETACGVCHSPITIFDEVTTCPSCGLMFHTECWSENRGCSSYGCAEVGVLDRA